MLNANQRQQFLLNLDKGHTGTYTVFFEGAIVTQSGKIPPKVKLISINEVNQLYALSTVVVPKEVYRVRLITTKEPIEGDWMLQAKGGERFKVELAKKEQKPSDGSTKASTWILYLARN